MKKLILSYNAEILKKTEDESVDFFVRDPLVFANKTYEIIGQERFSYVRYYRNTWWQRFFPITIGGYFSTYGKMSEDALATFFKENWRKGSPFTVKTPFIYLGGSLRKLIQVAAAMSAYQNIIIELGGCDPLGIEVIIEYITKNAYKNKNTVIVFDPYHDENIDFKLKFKPK